MNVAFLLICVSSICMMLATSPSLAFPTMIEGVESAITLALKLCAIYTVWLSVLKMMQASGLDRALTKLVRPIAKRLFKNESEDAYKWISINLASNMLGMGGAATPAGIKAMNEMHAGGDKASDNMILLVVINATSVQLIPATIIALRASNGATEAANIILPTFVSSLIATVLGVMTCKLLAKSMSSNSPSILAKTNKKGTLIRQNNGLKLHFDKNKKRKLRPTTTVKKR